MNALDTPRYTPQRDYLTGPAFGWGFRGLASGLLFGLAVWGGKLALDTRLTRLNEDVTVWGLLAFVLLACMWWVMMRSRTTLTQDALSQTWFWSKRTPLALISHAKFMRVRGLEWLIAPRLYVRAGPGPFVAFHAATPELWAEFEAMGRQIGR